MKIYAVNSSARTGGESKTEMVLDYLVEGMRAEGADVEIVNIFKKKINYCIGCFTCWTKTPGRCVHRDDMTRELFPKFMACDLAVLATPLFHFTVNANMKTFIERTLPYILPFFELHDGETRHPLRQNPPSVVAVSVAGFPEYSVFDQLSSYLNYLYRSSLLGEIYVPAAETLDRSKLSPAAKTVIDAIIQGGRELVRDRKISSETLAAIKTPTMDFETMAPIGNIFWQTCIDEGVTPKEFDKLGIVPRPDSIKSYLVILKMGFNGDNAKTFSGSYQFDFSGSIEGSCFARIDNGRLETSVGTIENPDVTVHAPFDLWMDVMTKKADGAQMFMEQKYQVEGDVGLMMRMGEFFGGGDR